MKDVVDWGIAALHRAIDGLSCTTAVHICYGYGIKANIDWKQTLGSEWRQYEAIFPALNESRIDEVSLECANSKVPLSLLRLLPDKRLLVGAIDVASEEIETPEKVAATIRQALEHADVERVSPCTNCGMAPLARGVAVGKLRALAAGAGLVRKEVRRGGQLIGH
jgi:5-methyltetrahydropteroyltriglutamate--homocysteine methyltransferase